MVASERQPQGTRGHDDPQAKAVEGSGGNAARVRRPWWASKPRLRQAAVCKTTAALTGWQRSCPSEHWPGSPAQWVSPKEPTPAPETGNLYAAETWKKQPANPEPHSCNALMSAAHGLNGSLLDKRAVRVHLQGIEVSLSQSQAGESQEGPDVGAGGSQTQLHCQFSHWDSAKRCAISMLCSKSLILLQILTKE